MPWIGAAIAVGGALLSSDSGKAPSVSSTPKMTPDQQALLSSLIQQFQGNVGGVTGAAQPYSGTFAAPLSNLQSLSLSSIENMSQEMGSSQTYKDTTASLQNALSGKPQDISGVFKSSVMDPLQKQFTDTIMPGVISNFGGNAAFGSDKGKAQQLALENLFSTEASAGGTLLNNANTTAKNLQGTALGQAGNILGVPLNAAVTGLNSGQVQQTTAQTQVTGQYSDFLNQQTQKNNQLTAMLKALGLDTTTPVVNPGTPSTTGQMLGGLAQGIGAAGGVSQFFGGSPSPTPAVTWT